jgi:DNA-binding transcriptional regulator LsrR (DeoR family)
MAADKFKEVKGTILDLYLQGYTKAKISEALGMSHPQVAYILYTKLRMHEKAPRNAIGHNLVDNMPKQLVDRVIQLAGWGYNKKEIAEDTRLPYNRVDLLVREANKKNLIKILV